VLAAVFLLAAAFWAYAALDGRPRFRHVAPRGTSITPQVHPEAALRAGRRRRRQGHSWPG